MCFLLGSSSLINKSRLQKLCFVKTGDSAATATRKIKRCCFRSYLRKKKKALLVFTCGHFNFPSPLLSLVFFSLGTKIYNQPRFPSCSTA